MKKESSVYYVYVVETEMGEFMFDQDLTYLTEDEYEPVASFRFTQSTLAPQEDWEEWFLVFTEDMIVDQIRRLIRFKMKQIAQELELH